VAGRITELRGVLERRKCEALSPYHAGEWEKQLREAGWEDKAEFIGRGLREGFHAGIPPITKTYTPPNKSSIEELGTPFTQLINAELERGRYIGPLQKEEVEELIGPFQTSPLNIIPKSGKPGKYRLIQNLSHPHTAMENTHTSSINQHIDSDDFPCTWGTFETVCLLISRLPEGSQAAVRDVKEAYRTVPLHHSQWPGIVVKLQGDDSFAVDMCDCFGLASGAGVYGRIGDTGVLLLRRKGIGPICKWVDDHIFFRIRRKAIRDYNARRENWAAEIKANGGRQQDGGRIWYRGKTKSDDRPEEFDEDCTAPVRQLSPSGGEDGDYTYSMADIDRESDKLGIIWEKEKDVSFRYEVPYVGFLWNLQTRIVSITATKREKYRAALEEWQQSKTERFILEEVQELHGKLLHLCHLVPQGRAFLTNLETFMGIFGSYPFMPHAPPKHTHDDLEWWRIQLETGVLSRRIPSPRPVSDIRAFSDASSEVGIGVVIGEKWRAWRLIPGWKTGGRDIGWAEAVGFLFLATIIIELYPIRDADTHFKVYGDNNGVVEGWWKGRSRNWPTNLVFRHIHNLCSNNDVIFHTRYVRSAHNPADGPSRGIYGDFALLLPKIPIPTEFRDLIVDFDKPPTPSERRILRQNGQPKPNGKPTRGDKASQGTYTHAATTSKGDIHLHCA
jgi:hypothetical protein